MVFYFISMSTLGVTTNQSVGAWVCFLLPTMAILLFFVKLCLCTRTYSLCIWLNSPKNSPVLDGEVVGFCSNISYITLPITQNLFSKLLPTFASYVHVHLPPYSNANSPLIQQPPRVRDASTSNSENSSLALNHRRAPTASQ